jgi:GNAT superfamily N-acetyltransferase
MMTILLLLISVYFMIKWRLGIFWPKQPCYHIYDFHYLFQPPHIVDVSLPRENIFTNRKDITTTPFSQLNSVQIDRLVAFLTANYLNEGDNQYIPTKESIVSLFQGHSDPSFLSQYAGEKGFISSRPCMFGSEPAYYVDLLCVDPRYRKKGIAPQLIQTLHWSQRHACPSRKVSVFKREQELTGIVPLTVYSTYGIDPVTFETKEQIAAAADATDTDTVYKQTLLAASSPSPSLLLDLLEKIRTSRPIHILGSPGNIRHQLHTGQLVIVLMQPIHSNIEVSAAFFFRRTHLRIRRGVEAVSCIGTWLPSPVTPKLLKSWFLSSFWKAVEQLALGGGECYLILEDVSDSTQLTPFFVKQVISPTAYYLYNYIHPTVASKDVFILT